MVVVAVVATGVLVLVYPGAALAWPAMPGWAGAVADLIVISTPMLAAALVAAAAPRLLGGVRSALGLFRLRPTDVLYGVGAGLAARATVEVFFPTASGAGPSFDGTPDAAARAASIVVLTGAVLVTPVVEEMFFRGLLLRSLLGVGTAMGAPSSGGSRSDDRVHPVTAAWTIAVSTGLFVASHAVPYGSSPPASLLLGSAAVGIAGGALVIATRRTAPAIVAHAVSNLIGAVLLSV